MSSSQVTDDNLIIGQFARTVFPDTQEIRLLAGDASSRCYFRGRRKNGQRYIVMDSRADRVSLGRFQALAQALTDIDQPVPQIFADHPQGMLILEDFGDQALDELLTADAAVVMAQVLDALRAWQAQGVALREAVPLYDEAILREELSRFELWFVPEFMADLGERGKQQLAEALDDLTAEVAAIPRTLVHRDWHCRNLILTPENTLGIIDFQDALWGPAPYDLISITRDCYLRYPPEQVQCWEAEFARASGIAEDDWAEWCNLVALQRHVKVLGLFVRLYRRDGKPRYLADLPRVWEYAVTEAQALAGKLPFLAMLFGEYYAAIVRVLNGRTHG